MPAFRRVAGVPAYRRLRRFGRSAAGFGGLRVDGAKRFLSLPFILHKIVRAEESLSRWLTERGPRVAEAGLASMTAFASSEAAQDDTGASWSWEMRGVNGRGLDLRLRLPEGLGALEQPLRALLSARLTRGNVTLGLRLTRGGASGGLSLDRAALATALAALAEVEAQADLAGLALGRTDAAGILALRGVLEAGESAGLPETERLLQEAGELLAAFDAMRRAEGAALARVMEAQLARIAELTEAAAGTATARAASQGDRLRTQVAALLDSTDAADPARLAQELALLAVKADVTEEIDRLRAHVAAARSLIAGGGPVGRKLDFLMQEFNREANTLCAKSGDAGLTALGLDLKLTIDQMREQVQNVE